MGIEIVKDYKFQNEQPIDKDLMDEIIANLQIQSGSLSFGYPFSLGWILYILDEKIEVRFNRSDRGTSETKILNKENLSAGFGANALYDRINISVNASFEDRQLKLSGIRCARRDPGAGWHCTKYNDVILITW